MKIYGISPIIHHPQGWSYICSYRTKERTLENSELLCAWWDNTLEEIEDESEIKEVSKDGFDEIFNEEEEL